jgi:hypothetical protein
MFQNSIIKEFSKNLDNKLIATRWVSYQEYLKKIDFIKTVKEEKYQDGFLKDIFEECLGYTLDTTNPSLSTIASVGHSSRHASQLIHKSVIFTAILISYINL